MAELNLKQIIDRLNAEFTGETRKLVFWYDDKAEFAEDMETVELQNAKIYYLQPDNQFYTKYFLERVDKTTNYLIYAPFPKPDVRDNHLEDTMLYSRRFFADRASLLSVDLALAGLIGVAHILIQSSQKIFPNILYRFGQKSKEFLINCLFNLRCIRLFLRPRQLTAAGEWGIVSPGAVFPGKWRLPLISYQNLLKSLKSFL